jgi:hypothetical protein
MGQIYAYAVMVIIWLGAEEDDDIVLTFAVLRSFAKSRDEGDFMNLQIDERLESYIAAINKMFCRPGSSGLGFIRKLHLRSKYLSYMGSKRLDGSILIRRVIG